MRTARIYYRQEADGAWIGTSPDVPGYVAHGDTYGQAVQRTNEGLPWFAEEPLFMAHVQAGDAGEPAKTEGQKVTFAITQEPVRRYQALPVRSAPDPRTYV